MVKLAWNYMRYYKSQTFAIFTGILLTASLLSGISSLIYSSQKNDLENSRNIYGDWHYYVEIEKELYESVQSGEKDEGYYLKQCGKMEIRDVISEEFLIYFIHADEMYRKMAHRELLKGTFPEKENEIAADGFVLSNLGFSGKPGDFVNIGGKAYIVTGILKSQWAANADEMEVFVGDSFQGRGSQTFLYLDFDENKKLYKQLDAFLEKYKISFDNVVGNDEVIQYLGGEEPASIYDIFKFCLTDKQGNFTYILLKLQSDYNLSYNGMIFLLCLFSLFIVYSVFNISVSKRISEYGMMETMGISGKQIAGTMMIELWLLFWVGYPTGCFLGNGILSLIYENFTGVFGERGVSVSEQTLAEGENTARFFVSWDAMIFGFVFLMISLAVVAVFVVRSIKMRSLKEIMSGDTSFAKKRKIYAVRPVNMANVVVQKFMFANRKKVIGILLSLSVGSCIFLCTTYMVENLKVHAELSMMSDDGLGSEYRISLKSTSLKDTIPKETVKEIKNMPETDAVYASKYTMGEMELTEKEFLTDEKWRDFFAYQNQDSYFAERYGGICNRGKDGIYRIKYDVYGYDEKMIEMLGDFILEGEIHPEEIKRGNQVIVSANVDGQGNYYFYGKKPGDTITLRVPKKDSYTDERLKFQGEAEKYIEKEFTIAAVVSRPLAQEEGFLNTETWKNAQSVIMTNMQMEENFGIEDYSFVNASPAKEFELEVVSNKLLQVIREIPKAVLKDYASAIATQKNYLEQQQIFFSGIAGILLVISLFHITNSMSHTILSRRREYGIIRALGITDAGFYKMALKTGILYGILADGFIFFFYHLLLREGMDYYMTHIVQFLHIQSGVPGIIFADVMIFNVLIAAVAVMMPARRLVKENIIAQMKE